MVAIRNQLNFNSLLSVALGCLIGLAIKKLDDNNTLLVQMRVIQLNVLDRLANLEKKESTQDERITKVETTVEILQATTKK